MKHASMSFLVALANPAGIERLRVLLISVTASKSPGDAIGKPASIMSTPNSSKTWRFVIFPLNSLMLLETVLHHASLCQKIIILFLSS